MKDLQAAAGSFRDPGGRIYLKNGRVFRTVSNTAAADFEFTEASGLIPKLEKDGRLVASKKVSKSFIGAAGRDASYVLEHDKIPFISYPYEWPPALLKTAALLQLDILIEALDYGVTLSDSSRTSTGTGGDFTSTHSCTTSSPHHPWFHEPATD